MTKFEANFFVSKSGNSRRRWKFSVSNKHPVSLPLIAFEHGIPVAIQRTNESIDSGPQLHVRPQRNRASLGTIASCSARRPYLGRSFRSISPCDTITLLSEHGAYLLCTSIRKNILASEASECGGECLCKCYGRVHER